MRMETTAKRELLITEEEKTAFTEFKRTRKEAQVLLTLKKVISDASRRETDRASLKKICEFAKREKLGGVLVSPVNVAAAKKLLAGSEVRLICLIGGSGETLPAVKKYEAKRALRAGARELRLVPCYSALVGGNLAYLKREIKKVKRAAKGIKVCLSLEDHALGEEDITLGTRAACGGGADGVAVRGEMELLLRAVEIGAGKIEVDCSGVENAEQLRALQALGAARLVSPCSEQLSDELFASLSNL